MKLTQSQIARLHTLADKSGRLLPSSVVSDAKHKSSPLHTLFEWNIKKAAAKHWTLRAREIIGSVTVVVTTQEFTIKSPCYVHDTTVSGEGYRSVVALRNDPVNARESLIYTLEVAAGHIRRAYDLAAPLGLQAEVDHLLASIVGVQRMIKTAA